MVQHIDIVERYGYNLYVDVYDPGEGQAEGDNWVFGIEYIGKLNAADTYEAIPGVPELNIDQKTLAITADIDIHKFGCDSIALQRMKEAFYNAYSACIVLPAYIHEWISLQK